MDFMDFILYFVLLFFYSLFSLVPKTLRSEKPSLKLISIPIPHLKEMLHWNLRTWT